MGDFNKTLSIITFAGIAGLVVLNYKGANALLHTVAGATTGYVKTVQGR